MTSIHYRPSQNSFPHDGGKIYLIVADETEEFNAALRLAARAAKANDAKVAILYVMEEEQGFFYWGKIEERVKLEQRQEAEKFLTAVAAKFKGIEGQEPILYIEEGPRPEAILAVIAANPAITRLILGGDTRARSPGPLVSYFSGKGMARLSIPLIIVPGHITPENMDRFSQV